jgi:hypothetical protein
LRSKDISIAENGAPTFFSLEGAKKVGRQKSGLSNDLGLESQAPEAKMAPFDLRKKRQFVSFFDSCSDRSFGEPCKSYGRRSRAHGGQVLFGRPIGRRARDPCYRREEPRRLARATTRKRGATVTRRRARDASGPAKRVIAENRFLAKLCNDP